MRYMLLIHQGDTPTPGSDAWDDLSEEEQGAVYAAYKSLHETPGMSPGLQLQPPETATTVRVQDGRTLVTDGPFDRGLPDLRGHRSRRGDRAGRADSGGEHGRRDRGPADRGVVGRHSRAGLP